MHMAQKERKCHVLPLHVFHCENEFEVLRTSAMRTAPKGKMAGTDETFLETFQASPKLVSKLLCRIWERSSKMNYVLKDWRKAFLYQCT